MRARTHTRARAHKHTHTHTHARTHAHVRAQTHCALHIGWVMGMAESPLIARRILGCNTCNVAIVVAVGVSAFAFDMGLLPRHGAFALTWGLCLDMGLLP
uniref:Uncharacterized protein n=1 Tax=Dunaliella tertiolecta TaxID=3047 RepID=A0A7S3VL28_DUNTE